MALLKVEPLAWVDPVVGHARMSGDRKNCGLAKMDGCQEVTGLPICPRCPSPANLYDPCVRLDARSNHQIGSTGLVGKKTGARHVGWKVQVAEKSGVVNVDGSDHLD